MFSFAIKCTIFNYWIRLSAAFDSAFFTKAMNVPALLQESSSITPFRPLWVRGCRIGPTYPPACRKRRLIGGSLFAVGCNPCQWKRGSWLLSQFFVAALRRQYTALASISLSRKVKMAWLNQSAGSAKP